MQGCPQSLGNGTQSCPTAGGTVLTIKGQFFAQISLSVSVGSSACTNVVFLSVTSLTCVLPSGAGLLQPVVVLVASSFSRPAYLVNYLPASIGDVTGCPISTSPGTAGCTRAGGDLVTISGSSYGPTVPTVFVGGVMCTGVTFTVPDQTITCLLPAGTGLTQQVLFVQGGGGQLTIVTPTVSYQQCGVGTYAPVGVVVCAPCPVGTYADTAALVACKGCASGFSAPATGLSACVSCVAGQYSQAVSATVGATSCSPCAIGAYTNTPAQSICVGCNPGTFANVTGQSVCQQCSAGAFTSIAGSSNCTLAPPGAYVAFPASTQSTACGAGTYTANSGSTACTKCPIGQAIPTSGATTCANCSVGTNGPVAGQTLRQPPADGGCDGLAALPARSLLLVVGSPFVL